MKRKSATGTATLQTKRQSNRANHKQNDTENSSKSFNWSSRNQGDAVELSSEDGESNTEQDELLEPEDTETAQEKRIRLAKEYLQKMKDQEAIDEHDDGQNDTLRQKIHAKLQLEALQASGQDFRAIAREYVQFEFDEQSIKFYKGHWLSVTSICLENSGRTAYSVSKDGSILRWDLATGTKQKLKSPGEQNHPLLAVAQSHNGKYLAVGGTERVVHIYDSENLEYKDAFSGHRDTVSSLLFGYQSLSLFSGSFDRTIKHWNIEAMGYVETLFGHQAQVNALDCIEKERVLSSGRDRSVRLWKIPEETQLVLYGKSGSMDCVKMINREYYVTGGDDGSLSLWSSGRKKPVFVHTHAHGIGKWISSVAVMPQTDLVASGSSDGFIRLWEADLQNRTLILVNTIPQAGFINAMVFDPSKRFLLIGIGKEHRLGRWECLKNAKNGIAMLALPKVQTEQ